MASKLLRSRTVFRTSAASALAVTLSVLFMPLGVAQADARADVQLPGAPGVSVLGAVGSLEGTGDFSSSSDFVGEPRANGDLGEGEGESERQGSEDVDQGGLGSEAGESSEAFGNEDEGDQPGAELGAPEEGTEEGAEEADPEESTEEGTEVSTVAGPEEGTEEAAPEAEAARLPVAPSAGNHRLAGKDRYDTAARVSAQAYPNGADVVILATGAAFADAISVAPLAAKLKAPVLLTQRDILPQPTQLELSRLQADQVIVVGGKGAVSEKVANAAAKGGATLTRLSGPSRYETSLAISKFGWKEGASSAFIATGTGFADALTAGPAAGKADAPVLLVPKNVGKETAAVGAELRRLGVHRVYVAGGTGVVSAAVLNSVAGGVATTRHGGADRYETANTLLKAHFSGPVDAVYWASGQDFPDAVTAAGATGALGVPLAISQASCIPLTVNTTVKNLQPRSQVVLGGTAVLGQDVANNNSCFAKAPAPTISGTASVGSTLTAKTGTWSPTPSSMSYQWFRSGTAISGATGLTYELVKADAGKTVTFRVTAKANGFATTSRTSAKTAVVNDPTSINNPSSLNVVVNKKRPLNPIGYVPANLRLPVGIGNPNGQPLRAEAATALEKMHAAGKKAGYNYYLMSGYRSYSYQAALYARYVRQDGQARADTYSARPGHSEHQTGLAADIYEYSSCTGSCFGGSRAGLWLRNNAYKYGFILRYDQGMQHIVGYIYEPWHFRYVGTAVATDMHNRGIRTLEQYYGLPAAPHY